MTATIGGVVPILRVADLDASIGYYAAQLGFIQQWRSDGMASVARDRTSIMLCQRDQGHAGTWLWIPVSDVDALYQELEGRGARLRHPPANYPWGSRECQVTDLDDHVLRFGADLRAGEPMGEWLDGAGRRWLPVPGGGWRAAD
ncbi:MAG TPA: VOC family protein [Vicinamibacterales bacterium]|jgi:catechol 2,3-dioxygenase-like lactoylglutathione lyase family enzyme|nr:VOC family protein [Vicinamibacterales bacterium]